MTTENTYLTFNSNGEQAFVFYKLVFGGEFQAVSTFGEMPPPERMQPVLEEDKDRITHFVLQVSNEKMLMGSDTGGEWTKNYQAKNNFSISVNTSEKNETECVLNALVSNRMMTMPLNKTFWGAYLGIFIDTSPELTGW